MDVGAVWVVVREAVVTVRVAVRAVRRRIVHVIVMSVVVPVRVLVLDRVVHVKVTMVFGHV